MSALFKFRNDADMELTKIRRPLDAAMNVYSEAPHATAAGERIEEMDQGWAILEAARVFASRLQDLIDNMPSEERTSA